MQKTWATHFDVAGTVVHDHEFSPPSLAFCAFAALALLLDLSGLFHHNANLLLRAVVVGEVLAVDLGRRVLGGCHELALCCLERGRFLVPSDDWWALNV